MLVSSGGVAICLGCRLGFARSARPVDSKSCPPPTHTNLTSSERERFPFEINPDPVDLGVLLPGRSAQASISLHNPGRRAVSVECIGTSCPCLRAEPSSFGVGPDDFTELAVRFDPSHDPAFRGVLSVEVIGWGSGGKVLFRARVNLNICDQEPAERQRLGPSEKEYRR
ncbi:MAG: hypothetical protein ACP5XB_26795 [Isosphaeraceae bacterium]